MLYFYPRPPRGGRPQCRPAYPCRPQYFYPRPPRGGRLSAMIYFPPWFQNFYPRPPRGGRRAFWRTSVLGAPISIHALREEGDDEVPAKVRELTRFLSTPSARRATACPCEREPAQQISIHALREEGDQGHRRLPRQSRISIHALREEGDVFHGACNVILCNFYPRPPRGGRQRWGGVRRMGRTFLSTPSARRATWQVDGTTGRLENFYPRPPRGGRPQLSGVPLRTLEISIHALREEGDSSPMTSAGAMPDFYPRPPRGGRQQKQRQNLYFQTNYTTFCTNLEEP